VSSAEDLRACEICGNASDNRIHVAREMMFGMHDVFRYLECGNCGCLQLIDPPTDLSPYYPSDYYSFQPLRARNKLLSSFLRLWAQSSLEGRGRLDRILSVPRGRPKSIDWARRAGVGFDSTVLDVGSGGGDVLLRMSQCGFTNLLGIDPFLPHDSVGPGGIRLRKCDLSDVEGSFDFIMLHHSFEHMARPTSVMDQLRRLIVPTGCVLIRMPIVGYAWRHYKADWVQLDPPRHLFVHSQKSTRLLAERSGFRIDESVSMFDSSEFQFWGSEQYQCDIPLHDPRSYLNGLRGSMFSRADILRFRKRAVELNAMQDGDRGDFFLRPT
jgi:2-polyprenyl-3-methyl-5-hydroxy-6-metoxy-1,4-benzoquinol methylase